jgi:hypothetical protein
MSLMQRTVIWQILLLFIVHTLRLPVFNFGTRELLIEQLAGSIFNRTLKEPKVDDT